MRLFKIKMPNFAGKTSTARLGAIGEHATHVTGPDALPPALDSAGFNERSARMRSQGRKLSNELRKLLRRSVPRQDQQPKVADKSRSSGLSRSTPKLTGSANPEGHSQPFLTSGMRPAAAAPRRTGGNGFPNTATSLLQRIIEDGSGASDELRTAAQQLSDTVIFKAHGSDGTLESYRLMHFATPGEHGIDRILALNIPPDQMQLITQRLSLARAELDGLGDAYAMGNALVPPAKINTSDYIIVDSNGTNESTATRRAAAQPLAAGTEGVPISRSPAGASNGTGSPRTTGMPSNVRPRPNGSRPQPVRRPVIGVPVTAQGPVSTAASASGSSNNQMQIAEAREYVIKHAGSYLSDEELQSVINDTCNWHEMKETIAERATPHSPVRRATNSASWNRDSLDLFDNARVYLSDLELSRAERGELDLHEWAHIIAERIEAGAKKGEYPPSYTEASRDHLLANSHDPHTA